MEAIKIAPKSIDILYISIIEKYFFPFFNVAYIAITQK